MYHLPAWRATLVLLAVASLSAAGGSLTVGHAQQSTPSANPPVTQANPPVTQEPATPEAPPQEAQEPASQSDSGSLPVAHFTAESQVVVLHVNVLDRDGHPVPELPQSAFEVYEDGVRQEIQFFEPREVPLAAGLVIDASGSMLTRQSMIRAGVEAFAMLSRPGDEFFTVLFNERVWSGLPPGINFTTSRDLLLASLGRAPIGGKTALHDAVIEALGHLELASNQKKVLVVLSDGEDNASSHSEENMLHRAARSSALIYTIWSGEYSTRSGDPGLLRRLARGNGGIGYRPKNEREVIRTFTTVAQAMRRGYTIGYAPTNTAADGSYRRIKVLVHAPGRRITVMTREGYTARDERTD